MTTAFDPKRGLIVVPVTLHGPSGKAVVALAVDTGATATIVRDEALRDVGIDVNAAAYSGFTTAGGIEYVPRPEVHRVEALGRARINFPIYAHTMPLTATVDGVLGLDFLRGGRLVIDFRKGRLSLT